MPAIIACDVVVSPDPCGNRGHRVHLQELCAAGTKHRELCQGFACESLQYVTDHLHFLVPAASVCVAWLYMMRVFSRWACAALHVSRTFCFVRLSLLKMVRDNYLDAC